MNLPGPAYRLLADCQPGRGEGSRVPARHRALSEAGTARPHSRHWALIAALLAGRPGPLAAGGTAESRVILADLQRFFLAYSGVFALVALTAAVVAGLIASDRLVITPGGRVIFQGVHRALSLAAVALLACHILLEILAHRARAIGTAVPFPATGRTLDIGLGALAADLVLLIVLTGVTRRKFATHWTATWSAVHATAYLGCPLAILHGLLSGRPAKPYVDWSYGACVAVVALALMVRLVATIRSRTDVVAHPVPDHAAQALPPALVTRRQPSAWFPVQPPRYRALPGGAPYGTSRFPYGTLQDGIEDDAMPHTPGTP